MSTKNLKLQTKFSNADSFLLKKRYLSIIKQTISLAKKDPPYFYKYNLNSTGGEKGE